jgi:dihydroflavonol-4-reductase
MEHGATIAVTGATGFIGRWVVVNALRGGHRVVGSYHPAEAESDVLAPFRPVLSSTELDRLKTVAADLHDDGGWPEVFADAHAVIHTAAAVPTGEPEDRDGFIAKEIAGLERVLRSAHGAGVTRVVMTSSMAAVIEGAQPGDGDVCFGPEDWTDPEIGRLPAYAVAKTKAERLAWDLAGELPLRLTTICPGMVFGPTIDGQVGASMGFLDSIVRGAIPKVPPTGFEVVDVRDVAEVLLAAVRSDDVSGKRILVAAGYRYMKEIAETVHRAFPDRKVPTEEMPRWLVHAFALFIPEMRTVKRNLDVKRRMDGSVGASLLANGYRTPEEAIIEGARSIIENTSSTSGR